MSEACHSEPLAALWAPSELPFSYLEAPKLGSTFPEVCSTSLPARAIAEAVGARFGSPGEDLIVASSEKRGRLARVDLEKALVER